MKTTMLNKRFCKKAFLGAVMILSCNILFSQKMINDLQLITYTESDNSLNILYSRPVKASLESTFSLEDWMINPFNWMDSSFFSEMDNSFNEPDIQFEDWMLDPGCFFEETEKFEEEDLLLEEWMLDPGEFQPEN